MTKGLWVMISLLVLALAWLVSIKILYQPDSAVESSLAPNDKIMMSLDKFKGFHHDADILLKELTVLKSDTQIAVTAKDDQLLGLAINNSYRVMDNVNINRIPTIAPFEVCDDTLETLSRYATSAKTYYANPEKNGLQKMNNLKQDFNTQFASCQSIVNDQSVEALYQIYQ